jgi:hypothetical protein
MRYDVNSRTRRGGATSQDSVRDMGGGWVAVMTRSVAAVGGAAAALVFVVGCSSTPEPGPSGVADSSLEASVAQFRFDEGTRNLKAGVTNGSHQDIVVSRATIRWDGLAFPTVRLPADVVHPGQTAAFDIEYGSAGCDRRPAGRPVLVAVVDGRERRLALKVDNPGLFDRLHVKACAEQRLASNAAVSLAPGPRTVMLRGEEYLPADLVLRRTKASEPVRIVDLGGSVLLDLSPRRGPGALPAELTGDRSRLAFPVLLGSAHRCDAHALGQSSQTFLISAYLQVGDAPVQREVLDLSLTDRDRLLALIGRDCGTVSR